MSNNNKRRRALYENGIPGVKWGIYNGVTKHFSFNICEDTPKLAEEMFAKRATLYQRRLHRYSTRKIPANHPLLYSKTSTNVG